MLLLVVLWSQQEVVLVFWGRLGVEDTGLLKGRGWSLVGVVGLLSWVVVVDHFFYLEVLIIMQIGLKMLIWLEMIEGWVMLEGDLIWVLKMGTYWHLLMYLLRHVMRNWVVEYWRSFNRTRQSNLLYSFIILNITILRSQHQDLILVILNNLSLILWSNEFIIYWAFDLIKLGLDIRYPLLEFPRHTRYASLSWACSPRSIL